MWVDYDEETVAEVLLQDQHERPALLRRPVGAGWMVLGTYPVEHFAAARPRANPEDTSRLYRALATEAGVTSPLSVDDPLVHAEVLDHADGRRFAWIVSQHDESVVVAATIADGRPAAGRLGGTGEGSARDPIDAARVHLDPFDVRVFLVTD